MKLPSWDDVEQRIYETWTAERVVVDTAGKSIMESIKELLTKLLRLDAPTNIPPNLAQQAAPGW